MMRWLAGLLLAVVLCGTGLAVRAEPAAGAPCAADALGAVGASAGDVPSHAAFDAADRNTGNPPGTPDAPAADDGPDPAALVAADGIDRAVPGGPAPAHPLRGLRRPPFTDGPLRPPR